MIDNAPYPTPLGLYSYKRFVCWIRDWALITTILGTRHLLPTLLPPFVFKIDIGQPIWVPPKPLVFSFGIQYWYWYSNIVQSPGVNSIYIYMYLYIFIHKYIYTFQPPKPASLRDAWFAALCGCAGMWLLLARVWLCENLWLIDTAPLPPPGILSHALRLGRYKIFFYLGSFVHESIVLSFLPPTWISHTIARLLRNISPPLELPCVCHTPCNINDNNIV